MRQIVLDTETTGLSHAEGHRIIEIGCVELIDMLPSGQNFHAYINPNRDIDAAAERVHGLSRKFLEKHKKFAEIADDFIDFIKNGEMIIHNATFDVGFLNAELSLIGKPKIMATKVIDSLAIARKKFPGAPASLDALCRRFEIDISGREQHGALKDSLLLAEVWLELNGGRQSTLGLQSGISLNKATISEEKNLGDFPDRRKQFQPSERQIEEHREFIKKNIDSSLWEKTENF